MLYDEEEWEEEYDPEAPDDPSDEYWGCHSLS